MDWERVIELSVAMPNPVWRQLYPYMMLSATRSPLPGLQFQALLTDMATGEGTLRKVGLSTKSLRRGIRALERLKLITVTKIGREKPVYAIQALTERHYAELVKALESVDGNSGFVTALQGQTDEAFWSYVAPLFRGERMSARQLLHDELRGQLLLIEDGSRGDSQSAPPDCESPTPDCQSGGADSQSAETSIFRIPLRSRSSMGDQSIEQDGGVAVQRRSKEEVARHRQETKDRKARNQEALREALSSGKSLDDVQIETPVGGVGKKNTRGGESHKTGKTKTERRARKATVQAYRPETVPGWQVLYPQLKIMFGDDCIDIWEDGTIHANPDSRAGTAAWEILGFTKGFVNPNWGAGSRKYFNPGVNAILTVLKAYQIWTTRFYGEPCKPEAVVLTRQILWRTREKAKTSIPPSRILMAVAGMAYQIVQCKVADKPQFLPNDTGWLSMFTHWHKMSGKYAKGISMGEVPPEPEGWLMQLPEGDLMLATKEELAGLVKPTARPGSAGPTLLDEGDVDLGG